MLPLGGIGLYASELGMSCFILCGVFVKRCMLVVFVRLCVLFHLHDTDVSVNLLK